jgi:L-aspartate oxidase
VLDYARAVSVIVEDGVCVGARFLQEDGGLGTARAGCTLLATGGAGQVYRETTNPPVATGDGVAIAYLAGAAVADLEFVQFHPTALDLPGQPRFLLSEALRGEGAQLVNADGERFMVRYDPAGDLAPRDRVSRGIAREAQRTQKPVYLTLAHLDPAFVHGRFPLISSACRQAGLDLATDRIPIGPAAHYVMGGVVTDLDGRTTIPGLLAAGEVACTGVHGANRLASNSLLEGLVFGARAGAAMRRSNRAPIDDLALRGFEEAPVEANGTPPSVAGTAGSLGPAAMQDLMWRHVGLFRDGDGLQAALTRIEPAWHAVARQRERESLGGLASDDLQAASLLTVGRLIARAALRREESRGGHFRLDFPERDDRHWQRRILERRV